MICAGYEEKGVIGFRLGEDRGYWMKNKIKEVLRVINLGLDMFIWGAFEAFKISYLIYLELRES